MNQIKDTILLCLTTKNQYVILLPDRHFSDIIYYDFIYKFNNYILDNAFLYTYEFKSEIITNMMEL